MTAKAVTAHAAVKKMRLPWLPITIFLLLTFGTAISGYLFYEKQKKELYMDYAENLRAVADLKAIEINHWRQEKLNDGYLIFKNRIMVDELLSYLRRPDAKGEKKISAWMAIRLTHNPYSDIVLFDAASRMRLSARGGESRIDSEELKIMDEARQKREVALSDLHRSEYLPQTHLETVVPLIAGDSSGPAAVGGFILLFSDPQIYLFPLIRSWPTSSPSAETLLVRREGDKVLFLNELRHRKNTAVKLRLPLSTPGLPAAQAIMGKVGVFRGQDYRGVPVWSVVRPVPNSNWFIVAKIDQDEIERPIRRSAQWMSLIVLSLVLVAAMTILYLWQRQNARFRLNQFEALRESEDKFKYVFDNSMVGKSITLPNGEISVNKAFCDMLGYSAEELKPRKWQELTHAADIGNTEKALDVILSGKKDAVRFEKRYLHKNGTIVWADVSTALRRDAQGKPLYFMTSVLDISERKQAEKALQESEIKFHALFNTMQEGLALHQLVYSPSGKPVDYRIIDVNPAFEKVIGITRAHALNRLATDLYGIVAPPYLEEYAQVAETGQFTTFETYFPPMDKHFRIAVFSPGPGLFATIFEDITERKKVEDALRARERQISLIYDTVEDVIFNLKVEKDGNYYFTSVNQRFLQATGLQTEQIIGKRVQEVIPEPSLSLVLGKYAEAIRTRKLVRWEETTDYPTGRVFGDVSVDPVLDDAGNCIALVGSVHDITDRKNAEEEIRKLNAELEDRVTKRTTQLEASNKELEAFSYSVSHDLRAPLRAIDGFSRIVLEEYATKLDEEGRRLLDVIRDNTHKMGQLIDDLLAFSRLSRQQMAFAPVDLAALAATVFAELKNAEKGRKIELEIAALPAAFGDRSMLRQVLQNLLSNAIKFTRNKPRARIELAGWAEKGENIYQVNDNGVGFEMKYVNKLFGVFQRLHDSREFEGTGVGLAIVQRIILRHGGRVWAESTAKGGATFYFALPVAAAGPEKPGDGKGLK